MKKIILDFSFDWYYLELLTIIKACYRVTKSDGKCTHAKGNWGIRFGLFGV